MSKPHQNRPKNIVLICTDEQRHDSFGFRGQPVDTPHLDQLAQESRVFKNAFTVSTLCVPSRVSLFTGQYPQWTQSCDNSAASHIHASQTSLVQILKAQGYALGLCGKNHTFDDYFKEEFFDFWEEYNHWGKEAGELRPSDHRVREWRKSSAGPGLRTNDGMMLEGLIEEPEPFPAGECINARMAEDGVRFLESHRDEPFFLYYAAPDPHWPSVVCEPYHSRYAGRDIALEAEDVDWSTKPFRQFVQSQASGFDNYTSTQRKEILNRYFAQLSAVDDSVGSLLAAIDRLGLRDETIVIFMSDHGNFGGRFGLCGKTGAFYEPLVRIPLFIRVPGSAPGVSESMVSSIDILPTLLDVLGFPHPDTIQGSSFASTLHDPTLAHRECVFAEVGEYKTMPPPVQRDAYAEYNRKRTEGDGPFWFIEYTCRGRSAMIRTDEWKYCRYADDSDELYDLKQDPLETRNLIDDPGTNGIRDSLSNRLLDWLLRGGRHHPSEFPRVD